MSKARILAPWVGESEKSAVYHVTSRVVERRRHFGSLEKEQFVKMMRIYESFCGVRILSYCVMSNHFHLLVEVPAVPEGGLSDEELLEKLKLIKSAESVEQTRQLLESLSGPDVTEKGRESYEELRQSYFRRMWDLGQFMKVLKQRFSRWFNQLHQRKGTLWEERYSSSLVEAGYAALVVSAYIDLNPVRAGMVDDPRRYRWCSYATALAGNQCSRLGILRVLEMAKSTSETDCEISEGLGKVAELKHYAWRSVASRYRVFLYQEGEEVGKQRLAQSLAGRKKVKRQGFSKAEVQKEEVNEGVLPMSAMLEHRMRHFIDGAVVGSQGFVSGVIGSLNAKCHRGEVRKTGAARVKGSGRQLWTLRHLLDE